MNRSVIAITRLILALGAALGVALGVAVTAEPPGLISYQGVLRDAADRPLNGTYDMIFRFVNAPSGGTLLLTDYHTGPNSVAVNGGIFTVYLGGGTLAPGTEATILGVFANYPAVYVEMQVGAETLNPRVQVVSAGYALNAGRVGGQPAADFVDKSAAAQTKAGPLTANGGLVGNGAGALTGVEGTSAGGSGVKGSATAASGTNYGVYGVSASTSGTGVVGEATAASGAAWGVYGKTLATDGVGVLGSTLAVAGNTEGVRGQSSSPTGKGMVGAAFATSGASFGVYGESRSSSGTGVYGRGTATSGMTTGVGGETFSSLGTGVAGVAHASSGDAWGVYGATTSPTGWGVFADGGLAVQGDLVVTGQKSFLTEHPSAPDLSIRYACIEGGEVGVYQRGNANLRAGAAHVTLPADFPLVASGQLTVQVTPLEASSGLFVPEGSIGPSGFDVREMGGGTSNARFSYLVMAERAGYEGAAPIRHASIGERILIAKRLSVDQRMDLRAALGRAGEDGLDPDSRADLYGSIQRGDYDGACRLLGGCTATHVASQPVGPREPAMRSTPGPPVTAARGPALPAQRQPPAPESRIETEGPAVVLAGDDRGSSAARILQPALLAEPHPASERVETGDVVVVDRARANAVRPGSTAFDPGVVGVVAEVAGAIDVDRDAPVAIVGTALCKVDAGYGSIAVGDLLVASSTPGHAMRSAAPPPGTIVGKALEPLENGTGLIRVFVMPR